ncbi:50S ribosomal protein L13 [Candidatus Roizmanbacteria bacterium RIFCSPLOWO2_01_FULL_37_13]|uniref:Large ribosomal subunit protein uL13 n=1 Tax=Candidatus Roizmanbacteria bacterium RIFCSPHIGHO2_02_FULL_38_11 TaxID=1802039 RepID=A0A1F7H206_9BACT|nr:MAG: 50S ribosomal protein L13 [Candidatus Roizmanbacteria bacterium RIFCSPHIGHO2_02_FULL_38_11]OGK40939.1 MAG: 50S ribosomal protein L13 [Candidatus Roizmanbacteria bacterium RIFCSPLOWO2_01_FULL_37_13]
MVQLTQSTKSVSEKNIKRNWHLIDVKGKILGRIVPEAVKFLQARHKRDYSSYLDAGDFVVVINAKHVVVTGKKANTKLYTSYSGYPGGLKSIRFEDLLKKNPDKVIRHAVSGMLPKNKLRDKRLARLFIFPDEKHTYNDKFKN